MQYARVCLSKLGLNCQFLTDLLFFFHYEYTIECGNQVFIYLFSYVPIGNILVHGKVWDKTFKAFSCLVIHVILHHLCRACKFSTLQRTESNIQLMTSDVNHEYSIEIDCAILV